MKYLVHYEARMDDGHDKYTADIGYECFNTEEEAREAVEEFNQNNKFTNIERKRRRFWTNTAWYEEDTTHQEALQLTIKQLREEAGLSQGDVARRYGSTRQYISQLENNYKDINLDTMLRLSEIYKINPTDFIIRLEKNLEN